MTQAAAQPAQSVPDPRDLSLMAVQRYGYMPAFFNKLASLGVNPQNEEEAERLLTIAARVHDHEHAASGKAANDRVDWLNGILQKLGGAPAPSTTEDQYYKAAAAQLVADERLRDAALILGHASGCLTAA